MASYISKQMRFNEQTVKQHKYRILNIFKLTQNSSDISIETICIKLLNHWLEVISSHVFWEIIEK